MSDELREFIVKQLELHREILLVVKEYADKILREVFEVEPDTLKREDPSTYYAITMELARSIFVNYSVEYRKKLSR